MEQERHLVHIHDQRCPFCHEAVRGSVDLRSCEVCTTIHHLECWEENRCACAAGCVVDTEIGNDLIRELEEKIRHSSEGAAVYGKVSLIVLLFSLSMYAWHINSDGILPLVLAVWCSISAVMGISLIFLERWRISFYKQELEALKE